MRHVSKQIFYHVCCLIIIQLFYVSIRFHSFACDKYNMSERKTQFIVLPNSGGSRKSVRGWHFIQGGGDHGEKVVFKAHSRQYNPYFLGFV
jgi:hypothetical protein